MKIFQRKKKSPSGSRPPSAMPDPDRSFYSREPDDALSSGSADYGTRNIRRTSRHNPAGPRKKSNRVSDWAISLLVLRVILIVVLLGGGYLLLRLVLSRAAEPTQKEMLQWERNAEKMNGTLRDGPAGTKAAADAEEAVLSGEEMEARLDAWAQTERHLRAAEALARRQIGEEALSRIEQALRISPQNRTAMKHRVDFAVQAGDFSVVIPLCFRLLDQDSTQTDIRTTLLMALYQENYFPAAIALADHLLERNPGNVPVLEISAEARLAEGRPEEALAVYKQILSLSPRNALALQGAAWIYRMRQEWAEAVPYYQELLEANPSIEIFGELARCYAYMNEAGKAVIMMGQASAIYGEKPVADWLREADFDSIRESVDFRAFADRIVGVETRKAIEEIREREADPSSPALDLPGGLDLPSKPDLQLLKPGE